jgi:hypothetical protein
MVLYRPNQNLVTRVQLASAYILSRTAVQETFIYKLFNLLIFFQTLKVKDILNEGAQYAIIEVDNLFIRVKL